MIQMLPYENASSGRRAVAEMEKTLRAFGASSFGCFEDFDKGEVIVQFEYRQHRPAAKQSRPDALATWRRFQAAFTPKLSSAARSYDAEWRPLPAQQFRGAVVPGPHRSRQ